MSAAVTRSATSSATAAAGARKPHASANRPEKPHTESTPAISQAGVHPHPSRHTEAPRVTGRVSYDKNFPIMKVWFLSPKKKCLEHLRSMVLPTPSENLKPSQQIGQCQEEVDLDEPPEKEPVFLVTCPSFAELWGLSQIREREIFSQQLRPNDSGQGGRSRTVDRELLLPPALQGL